MMLRDQQLSILRDISQSIAFADDKHGAIEKLIIDGYVMKDGDLFGLTPKGISALEENAAALADAVPEPVTLSEQAKPGDT